MGFCGNFLKTCFEVYSFTEKLPGLGSAVQIDMTTYIPERGGMRLALSVRKLQTGFLRAMETGNRKPPRQCCQDL